MARYSATDASERRTVKQTIQLAPSERAELEAAAKGQGTTLSAYAREQLLRRDGQSVRVAGVRRNPEAAALMRALEAAAVQNSAVGNNLNQIARQLNATGELRDLDELRMALGFYQGVAARHLAALDRVLDL